MTADAPTDAIADPGEPKQDHGTLQVKKEDPAKERHRTRVQTLARYRTIVRTDVRDGSYGGVYKTVEQFRKAVKQGAQAEAVSYKRGLVPGTERWLHFIQKRLTGRTKPIPKVKLRRRT